MDTLSPQQQDALHKFQQNQSLFITGPGGTGKTKLIKNLVEAAQQSGKKYQVCALTGCAAILLGVSAKTIHSWSGIGIAKGSIEQCLAIVTKKQSAVRTWKSVKILIIDEVSMMSKKIFNLLNLIAKTVRKSTLPFGGIQIVLSGDFFQLPPVGTMEDPDTAKFCFESEDWNATFAPDNQIMLTQMFRQTDPLYIEILNEIRRGNIQAKNIDILKQYQNRTADPKGCRPTKLIPTRNKVDAINEMKFNELDEDEYHYEKDLYINCTTYVNMGQLDPAGKPIPEPILEKCRKMTNGQRDYEIMALNNNTMCDTLLKIKKGAPVMCIANIDLDLGICNGSQGIVQDIVVRNQESDYIIVKFDSGITYHMKPYYWQSDEYPTIAIKQYPLILSWAVTIHKIQGATLAKAEIDIGSGIFEHGQTYVALSRIKTLDGLYLSAFDPSRITANPKVITFYDNLEKTQKSRKQQAEPEPKKTVFSFEKYTYTESKSEPTIKIIKL